MNIDRSLNSSKNLGEYETDNLKIATYLYHRGVKLKGCKTPDGNYFKVYFVFEDPKNKVSSLEEDWLGSNEKKYTDTLSHFRSLIERSRKNFFNNN